MTPEVERTAEELLELFGTGKERKRLTETTTDLDLATAYRISEAVRRGREAKGDRRVGRKIGFTNYRMWDASPGQGSNLGGDVSKFREHAPRKWCASA